MSRVVRIPPDVLVVVAAGRALERHERLAAIRRFVADDVGDDQRVGILGMDVRHDFVDTARGPSIGRRTRPALAGIVGPIDPGSIAPRFDGRIETPRVAGGDRYLRVHDSIGQALLHLGPGRAAVSGFEEATIRAVPRGVLPRALPLFPESRVDDRWVGWIDIDILATGVLVLEEDAIERPAAVRGAKDPPLLVGPVRMPERGDEEAVRILGVDGNLGNLLRIAKTEVRPGLACVG